MQITFKPAAVARPNRLEKKSAFTLVELLVVIGIIGLLLSILIPTIKSAVESSAQVSCLANLRQLGAAELAYAMDNDSLLTYGGTWSTTTSSGTRYTGWCGSYMLTDDNSFREQDGFLYPYLKTSRIDGCPRHNSDTRLYYGPVDYAYNCVYLGNCPSGGSVAPFLGSRITLVQQPDRTAMFWDSGRISSGQFQRTFIGYPTSYPRPGDSAVMGPNFNGRHKGGVGNIVWTDGHASSMKPAMYGHDITAVYIQNNLGDIDEDGNDATDELYSLVK